MRPRQAGHRGRAEEQQVNDAINDVLKTLEYMADNGYQVEFEDQFGFKPRDIYTFLSHYQDLQHELEVLRKEVAR